MPARAAADLHNKTIFVTGSTGIQGSSSDTVQLNSHNQPERDRNTDKPATLCRRHWTTHSSTTCTGWGHSPRAWQVRKQCLLHYCYISLVTYQTVWCGFNRSTQKAQSAAESIRKATGNEAVHAFAADLASHDQVESATFKALIALPLKSSTSC